MLKKATRGRGERPLVIQADRFTHIGIVWGRRHRAAGVIRSKSRLEVRAKTYGKEDPLSHLTVLYRLFLRIEPELALGIVMLGEIEQDSG